MQLSDRSIIVASLREHPAWGMYVTPLRDHRSNLAKRVLGGKLDEAAYQATCGEIRGLDALLSLETPENPHGE